MEKLKLPNSLLGRIVFHSDTCETHHINKMVVGEKILCPRCEKEKWDKQLEDEINTQFQQFKHNEKFNTLFTKSIIEDQTILEARFDNYSTSEPEETYNKNIVQECLERYKAGEIFNLILQGKQGTGKSHLSYSTLYSLNETKKFSCLFISVDGMLRKIKGSFSDRESHFTEDYFNELLSSVDFLCLDDLGAETGAIDSDKRATDFVQRVLYASTTVRQGKPTIVTTNLDSKTLYNMYDKKLISRLFKTPKYVIFKETKDKRTSNIPF